MSRTFDRQVAVRFEGHIRAVHITLSDEYRMAARGHFDISTSFFDLSSESMMTSLMFSWSCRKFGEMKR